MSRFDLTGASALITGASAGIGREFARQLVGRAGSLVLVARRRERLEELRDELMRSDPNLNVHIREADLSDERAVIDLGEWLEHEKIAIDLLINNAGLGDRGAFVIGETKRVREMMAVNVVALTLLTHLLLPSMIEQKRGAILNVSSSAGFLPLAGLAVYAATKAYVTSFSEAIRAELRETGVIVTTLCPGPVHTEFNEVARRASSRRDRLGPAIAYVPVENVVRDALGALERDQPIVIPGFVMKVGMFVVRLTPMPLLRLLSRLAL